MDAKFIKSLIFKKLPVLIVAVLVFFGISENIAQVIAPQVQSVVEDVIEEKLEEKEDNQIENQSGLVVRVYDGDTFNLENGERVRLIGIDAPEVDEFFSVEAQKFLEDLILNKEVTLEKDKTERDQYDRLLMYVYVDGVFVNEVIVREGLAKAISYKPNTSKQEILEKAEKEAQGEGLGVWGI